MTLLILGLLLWYASHLFKRLLPEQRAAMGDRGKMLATALSLASIVLMVIGYRGAAEVALWTPPAFMIHINNLLMVVAFWLFAASGTRAWPSGRMRHPMLIGLKTWAVAHLLVNGDLASVVLFGGMLGYGVIAVILINRAEPDWTPPVPGKAATLKTALGTAVALAVVIGIHTWLGYPTYPR